MHTYHGRKHITKATDPLSRLAGTCHRRHHQQLRRCPDAALQRRYFRHFQRSLRFFSRPAFSDLRHLDVYFSGASRPQSHDPSEKFVPSYLFSFVVGFIFGKLLDVHELWIDVLPQRLPLLVVYFVASYLLISLGIALSNRCGLPIVPTDLFPRELSQITGIPYPKIKISFDVICLAVTGGMTFFFLGHLQGLGIGTVAAAFTMGKMVGIFGNWLDRHFSFHS